MVSFLTILRGVKKKKMTGVRQQDVGSGKKHDEAPN
jgi:hypothetical protein